MPPLEPCVGGCRPEDLTKQGSNAFYDRTSCYVCGLVTSKRKTRGLDPATCPHDNVTRAGSSSTTIRLHCTDCGATLDEMPKQEYERRQRVSKVVGGANTGQVAAAERLVAFDPDFTRDALEHALQIFGGTMSRQFDSRATVPASEVVTALQDAISTVCDDEQPIAFINGRPGLDARGAASALPSDDRSDRRPRHMGGPRRGLQFYLPWAAVDGRRGGQAHRSWLSC